MGEIFMKTWEQALEVLQDEISPVGYKTYVEVMVPRLSDENTICFLAPSNYHIEVLSKKYLDLIQNTLTFLTKKNYIIVFESKECSNDDENSKETNENTYETNTVEEKNDNLNYSKNSSNVVAHSIGLNQKYTFENYIIGTNNRFAHASAASVSENPGLKYNPLFIYGGVGLGKTHLMQAIGHSIAESHPNFSIIYTTRRKLCK